MRVSMRLCVRNSIRISMRNSMRALSLHYTEDGLQLHKVLLKCWDLWEFLPWISMRVCAMWILWETGLVEILIKRTLYFLWEFPLWKYTVLWATLWKGCETLTGKKVKSRPLRPSMKLVSVHWLWWKSPIGVDRDFTTCNCNSRQGVWKNWTLTFGFGRKIEILEILVIFNTLCHIRSWSFWLETWQVDSPTCQDLTLIHTALLETSSAVCRLPPSSPFWSTWSHRESCVCQKLLIFAWGDSI